MPKKRFSESKIIAILREVVGELTVTLPVTKVLHT